VGFGCLVEHDVHDMANGQLPYAPDGLVLADYRRAMLLGDTGADGSLPGKVGINTIVVIADAAGSQVDNRLFL